MPKHYQDNKVQIFNGHVLSVLKEMEGESVHCIVTSPPYWGLRDYQLPPQVWDDSDCEHEWGDEVAGAGKNNDQTAGELQQGNKGSINRDNRQTSQFCQKCNAWRGSLGLEPTPELYIQHIVQVFREVKRVLRKDGMVFLNLGDSYWGTGGASGQAPNHTNLGKTKTERYYTSEGLSQGKKHSSLKPKDLCGIPWRVALALQSDGWWLRSDIIWAKPNPMPESVTDRPTRSHEYVFLLTRSGTPQFWTHRDLSGTRTKPKADWRWVNQITDKEVDIAPPDWKEIIICPNCEGKGRAMIDLSCEIMGQWMENWVEDECPVCEGKKKVQKWKRINLWRGHDYFYDADAVREPHARLWDEKNIGKNNAWTKNARQDAYPGTQQHPNKGIVDALPNPAGRNLRSVWTIATAPFPKAHFATFSPKLVEPCIKAGTSEKGCCPKCQAPFVRVVEKSYPEMRDVKSRAPNGQQKQGLLSEKRFDEPIESKTIGWRPSCSYKDLKPIPCIVMDIFGGSGRTAIVAKKLGRKCIIIELKPEYCDMPLDELRQENIY